MNTNLEKIPLNKFINFIETAKSLKSFYVYLTNNQIYGFEMGLNGYIKHTPLPQESIFTNNSLLFDIHLATIYLKNLPIKNILEDSLYIDYSNMVIFSQNYNDSCIELGKFGGYLNNIICNVFNSMDNVMSYGSIKNDPNFLNCINRKSAEGAAFYIKDEYVMTLYNGLLPINKSDDVCLTIYNIGKFEFLSKFSIIKKKNQIIDVYIRYRKLNRVSH